MYTHPDFNYIAYNTIRMYSSQLTQPQHVNTPLWDKVAGIIPYYQEQFHIDGVMIDMGHALPMDLKASMVRTARERDPDFAFWDENFSVTRKSREEGYNAVFGFCWIDQHQPAKMKALCKRHASEGFPIPYFATPENHNTPRAASRAGGVRFARWSWVINNLLPAVPFIHSGFELGETYPINTGLDFTNEQQRQLPSEKLPLFSEYAYDWLADSAFTEWMAKVSGLRKTYHDLIVNHNPATFAMLPDNNDRIIAFARTDAEHTRKLAFIGSTNFSGQESVTVRVPTSHHRVKDLLGGQSYDIHDQHLTTTLTSGQCIVFEF
jgi:hypothetical protein